MKSVQADVAVIGSGAGGATTAALLAEAGLDVVVLEDGPDVPAGSVEPFSIDEMTTKYRNGGLTVALGRPPIAYVEGRCVGGSTEINSGLFHRPPPEIVDEWRRGYAVAGMDDADVAPIADEVEVALGVSKHPGSPPEASAVLDRGAGALGWRASEVPRVFRYDGDTATKQSMSLTFIPRARAAGARVLAGWRATKLAVDGSSVSGVVCRRSDGTRGTLNVRARTVFVCAGAIGSAALLLRSGIRHNVGRSFKVHPTIKIAARFASPLDAVDVPMHQVKQFAPDITLGGSISRPGHVAMALANNWEANRAHLEDVKHIGVYYASIRSDGHGRIRTVPGLSDPVVTYSLADSDLSRLTRGLVHLGELLLAAGATDLFPSVAGAPVLRSITDLTDVWRRVQRGTVDLMTIHLFATVPMGEDRERTAADSFGRVWGFDNLRVNDASLLPDAPGVNPQGTVMTIAVRNVREFLASA